MSNKQTDETMIQLFWSTIIIITVALIAFGQTQSDYDPSLKPIVQAQLKAITPEHPPAKVNMVHQETTVKFYFCGARTKSGKLCTRKMRKPQFCFQHDPNRVKKAKANKPKVRH